MLKKYLSDKRILLSILTIGGLLAYFWIKSRYPQLNMKQSMGDRNIVLGLSFDIWIPVEDGAPLWKRIIASTLNWSYTNRKGMTFGVLLAAGILTLLSRLNIRPPKSPWLSALLGMGIGAPLGVCANCATPIGQGFYDAGFKKESSLALVLSSPTLNIVVLSILFTTFPYYISSLKLGFTLLLILVLMPLLAKMFLKENNAPVAVEPKTEMPITVESWPAAIKGFVVTLCRNLWFVIVRTVPLMILAGFLGSALIEMIPFQYLNKLEFSFLSVLAVSFLGAFFPVPVAFDVVVAGMLLDTGLPTWMAATLLFTLGIFSVYPLLQFAKTISKKFAASIFVTVVILGVVMGYAVNIIEKNIAQSAISMLDGGFLTTTNKQSFLADSDKIIKEHCEKIGKLSLPGFDATGCADKLNIEVAGLFSKDFCNSVNNVDEKKKCLANTEIEENKDIKKCLANANPAECQKRVIYHNSIEQIFVKEPICDTGGNDGLMKLCETSRDFFVTVKSKEPEKCSALPTEFQKPCVLKIVESLMDGSKSDQICKQYAEDFKAECFIAKAAGYEPKFNDMDYCKKAGDDKTRVECQTTLLKKQIPKIESIQGCDQYKDTAVNSLCKKMYLENEAVNDIRVTYANMAINSTTDILNYSPLNEKVKFDFGNYALKAEKPVVNEFYNDPSKNVNVTYFAHNKRQLGDEKDKTFKRRLGSELGISRYSVISNFVNSGSEQGLGAADINGDHYPDMITTMGGFLSLYKNLGGGKFVELPVFVSNLSDKKRRIKCSQAGFVDINNDGLPDIFCSTEKNVLFFINDNHEFRTAKAMPLDTNLLQQKPRAITFGDLDHNGKLDVYLGYFTHLSGPYYEKANENMLYMQNEDGKFTRVAPPNDNMGPTISVLFSDVNNDGWLDLFSANDFEIPDNIYLGDSKKLLVPVTKQMGIIPAVPLANMSYDTGDINNDLKLDIFTTEITFKPEQEHSHYCELLEGDDYREVCEENVIAYKAAKSVNINMCKEIKSKFIQKECVIEVLIRFATITRDDALCSKLKGYESRCKIMANRDNNAYPKRGDEIDQKFLQNVLLLNTDSGKFKDVTQEYGVKSSYWSWSGKFADLDNDTWQDIYVANGDDLFSEIHSNTYFKNVNGEKFVAAEGPEGLTEFLHVRGYTYVDYDLDGDMDIMLIPFLSPMIVFENVKTKNNSITFELRDHDGNRGAVGSKVIIRYGEGKHQVREIKVGGGALSFDSNIVHFGLKDHAQVDSVEIIGSKGNRVVINKKFPANNQYIVSF